MRECLNWDPDALKLHEKQKTFTFPTCFLTSIVARIMSVLLEKLHNSRRLGAADPLTHHPSPSSMIQMIYFYWCGIQIFEPPRDTKIGWKIITLNM